VGAVVAAAEVVAVGADRAAVVDVAVVVAPVADVRDVAPTDAGDVARTGAVASAMAASWSRM
jgi:hypothetical protein